ncbi:MAG: hypothetical protein ACI9CE_003639 [Flavobacterium sp.]|jgi:hypothetical protein
MMGILITIPIFAEDNENMLSMKERAGIVDHLLAVHLDTLPEKLVSY